MYHKKQRLSIMFCNAGQTAQFGNEVWLFRCKWVIYLLISARIWSIL